MGKAAASRDAHQMTLIREDSQKTSCIGKIRHRTRAAAIVARDAMLRRPNRRKISNESGRTIRLDVYSCCNCGFYHLGHSAK